MEFQIQKYLKILQFLTIMSWEDYPTQSNSCGSRMEFQIKESHMEMKFQWIFIEEKQNNDVLDRYS